MAHSAKGIARRIIIVYLNIDPMKKIKLPAERPMQQSAILKTGLRIRALRLSLPIRLSLNLPAGIKAAWPPTEKWQMRTCRVSSPSKQSGRFLPEVRIPPTSGGLRYGSILNWLNPTGKLSGSAIICPTMKPSRLTITTNCRPSAIKMRLLRYYPDALQNGFTIA